MTKMGKKKINPPQTQKRPGSEEDMKPTPVSERPVRPNKLQHKVALITGGDSGIGRAVAILFAEEGADIALAYLNEHEDALKTRERVEENGRECILIDGDIANEATCRRIVKTAVKKYGRIDVLVNNAAIHYERKSITEITADQLRKTFATNIFSMFWITQNALPGMRKGSTIINTSSVTAYRGSPHLIDYASTKGAIVAFTRSLAANLVSKGIRVNGVAPGPIWTPLIASSFSADRVAKHGSDVPMKRAGEPAEVAPSFLFLACEDSSYMTGQFLHPNGGEILNT
jgi:NAD(P)-dependent dehydrogenase (short-subunit alcohol dehydrogenase family)